MSQENKIIPFNGPQDALCDEAELLFSRNIRLELVKQYTRDGKIPQDPEQAEVLLKALKDMDASTFTRMKIKSDEKNTAAAANSAALVAEALKSINGNTGRGEIIDVAVATVVTPIVQELPDHLKRKDFIPGEMDQGTQNTTYDAFMKSTGAAAAEADK